MFDEPPMGVRAAFGVSSGSARRLPGGGGTSWQVDGVVLKPGQHPVTASWVADVFAGLAGPGFRVPRPVSADGSWVVDGWAAWTAVDGEPDPVRRWPELVDASRAFHAAIADVPAPRWIGRGRNRWAVAERVAWDGAHVEVAPELADLVEALRAATRPVRLPRQLVHADLAGNVLFADGQPPAVIDFAPSWRPAGYAVAIAAVDLLFWYGAPPDVVEDVDEQLLLRAAIWRLVTESLGRPDAESRLAVRRATEPAVELLLCGPRPLEFTGLRPVAGGHSRAVKGLAERADGSEVFVKTAPAVELAVYKGLGDRPFLAKRFDEPPLVLEALDPEGWVHEWTSELVAATRSLLHEVHSLPAPPDVPALGPVANPWDAIAADPARLLRMGACTEKWLTEHLDALRAAADRAPTAGNSLIHRDVCAANLWTRDGRLVLVDWASAAIGDPWLDHHLWLVAVAAEGGPDPDALQGPNAGAHAALIAGQQPLLTPARDTDPLLFEQRCRRLAVALAWATRLLP